MSVAKVSTQIHVQVILKNAVLNVLSCFVGFKSRHICRNCARTRRDYKVASGTGLQAHQDKVPSRHGRRDQNRRQCCYQRHLPYGEKLSHVNGIRPAHLLCTYKKLQGRERLSHTSHMPQVTDIDGDALGFDIIVETLRTTNLGTLQVGSCVNFERSARVGDEIGGHNVSGHVCTTATVERIEDSENNRRVTFKVNQHLVCIASNNTAQCLYLGGFCMLDMNVMLLLVPPCRYRKSS